MASQSSAPPNPTDGNPQSPGLISLSVLFIYLFILCFFWLLACSISHYFV